MNKMELNPRREKLITDTKILKERVMKTDREALAELIIVKLCLEYDRTAVPLRELLEKYCDNIIKEVKTAKRIKFEANLSY